MDRDLFNASHSHKCLHGVMVRAVGILRSNSAFAKFDFIFVFIIWLSEGLNWCVDYPHQAKAE